MSLKENSKAGLIMIYLNDLPQIYYCPLCGTKIDLLGNKNYCKHIIAIFADQFFEGNGCLYLNDQIRLTSFQKLKAGFPNTMDESLKLKYSSKPFKDYRLQNNTFTISFKRKVEGYYEDPIVRIVFREIED